MGVLDLSVRMTEDWDSYHRHACSSDSLVYVSPAPQLDDGPASIDLTVGDRCYRQMEDRYFLIGDGVTIGAYQSLLFETAQTVAMPYNVFGVVTGKGGHIFKGWFVSTGKINPGFRNKLKIGIYNGSNTSFVVRSGDPLCSCVFFEMESSISTPLKNYDDGATPSECLLTFQERAKLWLRLNKDYFSILLPVLAIFVSIFALATNIWLRGR